MFTKLILGIVGTLAVYGLYLVFIRPRFSPLRSLPGPPSESLIWGNLRQVLRADGATKHEEWIQKYGNTYVYKAFFNNDRLFTTDLRALNHIITHSVIYQKPMRGRENLSRIVGSGILVTEGDVHKQQRRIMNPSFGPAHIAKLTPIFFEKAMQMRDVWESQIPQTDAKGEDSITVEVLSWLGKATLDVIGQAGFDYQFHALDTKRPVNELNKAFSTLFHSDKGVPILGIIASLIPGFQYVPTKRNRTSKQAQAKMNTIGRRLVEDRKRTILGELSVEDIKRDRDNFSYTHDDKKVIPTETDYDLAERGPPEDLLSALIKANLDTELPDSQRLSDEAVLSQIPTFLVAGHETTSTGTTWALYALSQNSAIQTRLREELLAVPTDTPTMDELMALPYLDAVVRETMRIHAAVPSTIREATQDDVIPISAGYVDKNGVRRQEIKVSKGDTIFIPILVVNRSKEIWGEDALEFNPERWSNPPEASKAIPGVWGNQLSFLGGARSCIGYRFALVEMKALLFTIIRAFEFELAVPAEDIEKRSMVVTRPYVKSEKGLSKGAQLPVKIKRVKKP